jgi:NAD+ diphosphatase
MVGFRARATSEHITVDGEELVEARWFHPDELAARIAADPSWPRPDSIEKPLIDSWLAQTA